MGSLTYAVLPGGLSTADHDSIFELAGRGWRPTRIARRLLKHPSTVYWFMLRHALVAPGPSRAKPYRRGETLVVPYTPEEDAFIVALRVQRYRLDEIARLVAARFGTRRKPHSLFVRLVMLAAREDA